MANNSIWNDTEQSLVMLMQQGNKEALGKVYDKYAPMLMGLITRLVGDNKIAEDVLQHVFNEIWQNKAAADFSKERLFCKLLKMARDTIKEVTIKKTNASEEIHGTYKRVHIKGKGNLLPTQNNTMDVTVPFNIEKGSKEVLDLIYFNGCSFSEAAGILNIPLSSVKEKIKMAIEQLKVDAVL